MAVTLDAVELRRAIGTDPDKADRLLPVAAALVERYAPDAPAAIQNEAAIRVAGWLYETPSSGVRSESVGDISTSWSPSMTSALRHSGAAALLAPWRTRRAGGIGGTAETPSSARAPTGGGNPMNGGTSPTVRVALVAFRNPGAVFSDMAAMAAQEIYDAGTAAAGAGERAVSVAAPVECHQQRATLTASGFQWLTVAVPEGTDTPSHFRLSDAVAPDNWAGRWRQAAGTASSRGTNYRVFWWPVVQTSFPATLTVEWPL